MKNSNEFVSFLLLLLIMFNTSCRQEESQFEGTPPEERLQLGSNVANLLVRTTMNDGSSDNIIDNASCISIKLPVNVIVNSTPVEVLSSEDFDLIQDIFDENDSDEDIVEIQFPITIIFSDYSEQPVLNADDFQVFVTNCGGENQNDDDIECVDLQYPIVIALVNTASGMIDTVTLVNDKKLFDFVEDLDENDVVTISFPVTVILSDGNEVEALTLEQLESIIETYKDDCDENDNNDFDVNCADCTIEDLLDLWSGCSEWKVDKLFRDTNSLQNQYKDYSFNFLDDGSVIATSDSDTFIGTWVASGTGNNIIVVVDILSLPDFNGSWTLKKIGNGSGKKKFELSLDSDSLRFKDDCK
tara:strand:+ start:4862 stop:5932 length:1071 start_codon:yes stop_codon:yes gene_type:complete